MCVYICIYRYIVTQCEYMSIYAIRDLEGICLARNLDFSPELFLVAASCHKLQDCA